MAGRDPGLGPCRGGTGEEERPDRQRLHAHELPSLLRLGESPRAPDAAEARPFYPGPSRPRVRLIGSGGHGRRCTRPEPARPSGLRPALEARRAEDAERQVTPVTRLSIPPGTATALATAIVVALASIAPAAGPTPLLAAERPAAGNEPALRAAAASPAAAGAPVQDEPATGEVTLVTVVGCLAEEAGDSPVDPRARDGRRADRAGVHERGGACPLGRRSAGGAAVPVAGGRRVRRRVARRSPGAGQGPEAALRRRVAPQHHVLPAPRPHLRVGRPRHGPPLRRGRGARQRRGVAGRMWGRPHRALAPGARPGPCTTVRSAAAAATREERSE